MAGGDALSRPHLEGQKPFPEAVLAATVTWQTNPGSECARVECAADLHPGASFDGPARLPVLPSHTSRDQKYSMPNLILGAFSPSVGSLIAWNVLCDGYWTDRNVVASENSVGPGLAGFADIARMRALSKKASKGRGQPVLEAARTVWLRNGLSVHFDCQNVAGSGASSSYMPQAGRQANRIISPRRI